MSRKPYDQEGPEDWEDFPEPPDFSKRVQAVWSDSRICFNCKLNPTPSPGAGVCERCNPLLEHTFEKGFEKLEVFLQNR